MWKVTFWFYERIFHKSQHVPVKLAENNTERICLHETVIAFWVADYEMLTFLLFFNLMTWKLEHMRHLKNPLTFMYCKLDSHELKFALNKIFIGILIFNITKIFRWWMASKSTWRMILAKSNLSFLQTNSFLFGNEHQSNADLKISLVMFNTAQRYFV